MNQRSNSNSLLKGDDNLSKYKNLAAHKKIMNKYSSNNISNVNKKNDPSKNEKRLLEIKKQIVEKRLEAFGISKTEQDDR